MIEEIPAALDGERLDRVVAMLTGLSRSEASALVAAGEVRVNGQPVTSRTHRLVEGDELELEVPATVVAPLDADASVAFGTVYADADLVVIDKPAGLVVHPGAGTPDGTLVNGLLVEYPEIATVGEAGRPGIVHRLDRGTSGLLVVARSTAAYEGLVAALTRHDVERGYIALAWGTFDAKAGMIDAPIGRSPRAPTKMAVSARGKPARTRYEVRNEYHEPGRSVPARLRAGDRPHASDPRASRRHRPSRRRRRPLRRHSPVAADGSSVPARRALALRASGDG